MYVLYYTFKTNYLLFERMIYKPMEQETEKFYKLASPIKIYCPVMDAQLHLGCELLDDMSEFTVYILYMIGSGYSVSEIKSIIELEDIVVYEELYYMSQIKLCELSEGRYKLTELGEKYYRILCLMDDINSSDTKAQINCFTGAIMDYDYQCIEENKCDNDVFKLKVKIVKELYQNKNPSNSKGYLIEKYNDIISDILSEEEMDKLYVTVSYERGSLYKIVYINRAKSIGIEDSDLKQDSCDIFLKHELIPFKLKYQNSCLDKYRTVLPTLKNLNLFESELVSEYSRDLLALEKEEKLLNSNSKLYYYDRLTGEILDKYFDVYVNNNYNIIIPKSENIKNFETEDKDKFLISKEINMPQYININFVCEESIYAYEKIKACYFI